MEYVGEKIEDVLAYCKENGVSHYVSKVDGKPTGAIITMVYKPGRIGFSVVKGVVNSIKKG